MPETTPRRGAAALAAESLAVGAMFVAIAGMSISLALLIFTGPLATELPRAIGSFLIGGAIVTGVVAWRGRYVPSVAIVQDAPAVVMVPVAAGIAASGDLGVADVMVAIGIVALLTGLVMLALSRVSVGGMVRYLPTSIVVAFIAGTGWYLTKGGIEVTIGQSLHWADVGDLFGWDLLQRWLPCAALGLVITALARAKRIPAVATSLVVVASIGVFFAIAAVVSSISAAEADAWLVGPFPADASVSVISGDEIRSLDWSALLSHTPGLLAVVAVGVVAMMLNYSGVEMLTGHRTDYPNELRATGVAALLVAPFGSVVGFIGLGDTMLADQMGVRRRATPIVVAGLTGIAAFIGTDAVAMVPRFVTGGLLLSVGIQLIRNWGEQLRSATSWIDRLLSVVVVAVMAGVGILEGLAVGLIITCALFIVRYSRLDHVRRVSAGLHKSRVDRSSSEADHVAASANRIEVFELDGYLFFGSVVTIAERVRERCALAEPLDAVVLDFRHVSGVDTNGLATLDGLRSVVAGAGATFVLSSMDEATEAGLRHAAGGKRLESYDMLDRALEAVEEAQLAAWRASGAVVATEPLLSTKLEAWFAAEEVPAGTLLIEAGADAECMYIVVSGSLAAAVVGDDGKEHRLRRFGAQTFVGEIGFFGDTQRTANIIALTESSLLRLDRDRYEQMRTKDPDLAFELHDRVLAGQALRVRTLSDELVRALGS